MTTAFLRGLFCDDMQDSEILGDGLFVLFAFYMGNVHTVFLC